MNSRFSINEQIYLFLLLFWLTHKSLLILMQECPGLL